MRILAVAVASAAMFVIAAGRPKALLDWLILNLNRGDLWPEECQDEVYESLIRFLSTVA